MRRTRIALLGVSLALASALAILADNDAWRSAATSRTPVGHGLYVEASQAAPLAMPNVTAVTANDLITSTTLSKFQPTPTPEAAQTHSIYDRIRGNATFVRQITSALDWLQAHDSDAYQRVDTYITAITPSPYARLAQARPMPDGSCLVRALARRGMSVEMIAALLYHEASHCYQFATVGVLTSKEAEVFAYTEQIAFMERNGFSDEEIEYYHQVLDYYASQPDDGRNIPPPNF